MRQRIASADVPPASIARISGINALTVRRLNPHLTLKGAGLYPRHPMAPPKARAKPRTVTEFIAATDRPARERLREIRQAVRAAAPKAIESLKWGMPAHSYQRILVMYGAFKNHVSLFPGTPTVRAFRKELAGYQTSGSTVKFPLDRPVPSALVRRLVAARVRASVEQDGKWRTKS